MKYKGYTGVVELDEEQGTLYGRVIGLRDLITFQGDSVPEVVQAFQDSVNDYLEFCDRGVDPEKPYSGNFVVRHEPQLHRTIANEAEVQNVSLNSLIASALEKAFAREAKVSSRNGGREPQNSPSRQQTVLPRQPPPAQAGRGPGNLHKSPKNRKS